MTALPFTPLPAPAEMAAWDRLSVETFGIPHEMLMENAAREALRALEGEVPRLAGRRVLLLAGPGHNGGDALALARHLHDLAAEVRLVHLRPRESYGGPSRLHFDLAEAAGVPMHHLAEAAFLDASAASPANDFLFSPDPFSALWPRRDALPDILVDGLLGTGFRGALSPFLAALVQALNGLRRLRPDALLLALDVPSGLDGLTGRASAEGTVRADLTVTFEAAKPGLVLPEAAPFVGRLVVRPVGIPRRVREARPPSRYLLDPAVFRLLPPADPLLHKGSAGHLLVIGGSRGLTGAPMLASLAGLRAGAGLVTLACPGAVAAEIKAGHPDVMTLALGQGGWFDDACAEAAAAELPRFDAVAVGPGLGRRESVGEFLAEFLPLAARAGKPLLLDADALFWLAERPDLRGLLRPETVLTPHPGEMARLMGLSIGQVQADRQDLAQAFARQTRTVLVLKGAGTLVAEPAGRLCICPVADPLLAVAGSGDVLSGVIGALMSRALSPLQAACLGVYWHGFCGDILRPRFGAGRGALASELADALPQALAALLTLKDAT